MDYSPRFTRVLLFGRGFGPSFIEPLQSLLEQLRNFGVECYVYEPFGRFIDGIFKQVITWDGTFHYREDIGDEAQVLISLGGDGTFLEAAALIGDLPIPVAGINVGRLGFLADIAQEEISHAMTMIMDNQFYLDERTLIQVKSNHDLFGEYNFALNEITVHKRDDSSMIKIHAWLDDEFLTTYWADGLIIATPTGSTAYSMSVGGPLVLTGTGNFILSPIAPHNLTVRPLVFNHDKVLKLKVEGRSGNVLLSADSRSVVIDDQLELILSRAPFTLQTIRLKDHTFYQTLRNKLMWGADPRN